MPEIKSLCIFTLHDLNFNKLVWFKPKLKIVNTLDKIFYKKKKFCFKVNAMLYIINRNKFSDSWSLSYFCICFFSFFIAEILFDSKSICFLMISFLAVKNNKIILACSPVYLCTHSNNIFSLGSQSMQCSLLHLKVSVSLVNSCVALQYLKVEEYTRV